MNDGQQDPKITAGLAGSGDDRSDRKPVYLEDSRPDPDPDRDLHESWDTNQYRARYHQYVHGNYTIPFNYDLNASGDSDDKIDAFRYIAISRYGSILDSHPRTVRYFFNRALSKCVYRVRKWVAALQVLTHPGKGTVEGDRSSEGR